MERLSGADAMFLYVETPSVHMHTIKVAVVEPPPEGWAADPAVHRERLARRLERLPPFRRRIVEVPLGLHHPVWIEDPDFAIERHFRHGRIDPPGGRAELDRAIAEIASRPLDRSRPLWEVWMLEGLQGGRVAFVAKVHHAVADGMATARLLQAAAASEAEAGRQPGGSAWRGEPLPGRARLIRDALRDRARQIPALPRLLARTLRGARAAARRRRESSLKLPRRFEAPTALFNRPLVPERSFATATLPLELMRFVKRAFGATLNDVVLALAAGALRRYLLERGALPSAPLVAAVPVSTDRPQDAGRLGGNRVSTIYPTLPTHLPDPAERLEATMLATREAKRLRELLGLELIHDWSEFSPPLATSWVMRLHGRLELARVHPPPVNLIVSNVPGPREALRVDGARLVSIHSAGPLLDGVGLNLTVWSYAGEAHWSAIASRSAVPDPEAITGALAGCLDELVAAATARSSLGPAPAAVEEGPASEAALTLAAAGRVGFR